ncbi:MAG: hypothetical protein IPK01_14320 [Acidobacteria bacterium]|nr:hypothetical protein [Acidobacteriota bacterium]
MGVGLPVIYYRKNADPYASTQCTYVSGSNYDCGIIAAAMGGVVAADVIQYYVAAQDTPGNVSVSPSGGAGGLTANPPAAGTPPTTPNQYTIVGTVSGTFNVGVGETYTSLTNTGGIFEFINNSEVTGNITINITSDLSAASGTLVAETGTVALNQFASPFTVTIKPSGGARLINGPAGATALIRTNGASRVTIDGSLSGGTDRSLTIENTSGTTPQVVRFGSIGAAAITANTLKNCIVINGVDTSSAVLVLDNAGTAGTFNNITIQNNDIRRAFIGIFANATVGAGNGANLLITQNKLDTTGIFAIRNAGVYVQGADGATVSDNTVGNLNATSAENDYGIWLATGTVNTTVSNNSISTLEMTNTGAFTAFGIRDSGATAASGNNIIQNTVTNISTNGSTAVFGIDNSSGGTTIQRNRVDGVINNSTSTYGAYGINISTGNNVVVRNNFVSNVTGNMTGGVAFSEQFGIFGIRVASGTGHQIQNNSVNLYGLRPGTATASLLTAALGVSSTSSTGMDIRNNIFANNITGGTTSIANVSVYLPSGGTSAMNLNWNYNSYYFGTDVARAGAGQAGTTSGTNFFTTFDPTMTSPASNLRSYTSTLSGGGANDDSSQGATTAVPFVSDSDLHLSSPSNLEVGSAIPIVGLTNDYDNDPRPATTPDIGADEIVGYQGGSLPAGTYYNVGIGVGSLGGGVTVTNRLYLLGDVNGGGFTMTLGCDASVVGAGPTNFIGNGFVRKDFCAPGAFSYPVGTGGDYSPVSATITAIAMVPSGLTVVAYDEFLTGFDPLESISRNWQLDEDGDLTADLLFTYVDSDVNGNEADYRVWRRQGNGTTTNLCSGGPCVDTVNNILGPVNGVTTFSRWTGSKPLAPTAAEVSISGRVTTADGAGIKNAIVSIQGGTLVVPRFVRTGSFGYYTAPDLNAGETYIVTINSKRFIFSVPNRVVTANDSVTDVDFVADPQ